ncbi:MAG: penicillin-binding protein 2 [Candidatus Liptonbacteria bacterium]|nr:penicillin-binding protein 2 [Candidatus Liptonbacteria bacterium]
MGIRFSLIIAFLALGYGAILFHLYDLQVARGGYYLARANTQYSATGVLDAERGSIFFTDAAGKQTPAALNKDFPTVYVVPKEIEDLPEAAHRLAPLFNLAAEDLIQKMTGRSYRVLARKAAPELVQGVRDLDLKGAYVAYAPSRYYPMGPVASQVIGFVSQSDENDAETGRYGVEKLSEERLAGAPGQFVDGKLVAPRPGADVVLTIDPTVQLEAEKILSSLVREKRAKSGSVIVEDPRTGQIIAMANVPQFDPNNYAASPVAWFLNPTVQQIYEPGSVFKVFTMAAGIDSGRITPETEFVDTGSLTLNGRTIKNWDLKAHGRVTMTNVIEQSINTGAAFAERQTGDEIFKDYLGRFGFRDKTGVDLPGELKGDVQNLFRPHVSAITFATASYGQGVAVTPLHVINAFATLANGGKLMRPYLNAASEPQMVRRVLSPETASAVTEMMVSAVDKARIAKTKGYALAGKTGTAFVPDFQRGGYTDRVINTYVGFGPAADPRFVVLVKLVEPEGAPLAGLTVVPAFRDLAQFILNYYRIPPDRLDD